MSEIWTQWRGQWHLLQPLNGRPVCNVHCRKDLLSDPSLTAVYANTRKERPQNDLCTNCLKYAPCGDIEAQKKLQRIDPHVHEGKRDIRASSGSTGGRFRSDNWQDKQPTAKQKAVLNRHQLVSPEVEHNETSFSGRRKGPPSPDELTRGKASELIHRSIASQALLRHACNVAEEIRKDTGEIAYVVFWEGEIQAVSHTDWTIVYEQSEDSPNILWISEEKNGS